MLKRFLFLVITLFAAPLAAQPPAIMILGDSLSAAYGIPREAGWAELLEQRLAEQGLAYRVVNASISGDTSTGGLSRLGPALEKHRPKVLILELGANDGLRGTPPKTTAETLESIIRRARAAGAKVLLVGVRLPPNYGAAFNSRFASVFEGLSAEYQLPLVTLSLDALAGRPGMIQDDGLHPTDAAQPLILEVVWEKLKPLL